MSALLVAQAMLHSLRMHQAAEEIVIKAALPNDLAGSPLYVALKVMPGSAAALATWMADQGIENPVAASDLHITTVYSRTPVPLYQLFDKPKEVTEQLDPASYELGLLGPKGDLVLYVDSPMACASHEYAAGLGASYDHPSYRPHITLSYDFAQGAAMPPAPPPFALEVGNEYAEALKPREEAIAGS